MKTKKLGIITCNRYSACAGGKCLRALREREAAFSAYRNSRSRRSTTLPTLIWEPGMAMGGSA